MIYCKRHFIAAGFMLMLPLTGWSAAPVVDDSDNFAIIEEQQVQDAPVVGSKYDEPQFDVAQNENYSFDSAQDEGPALARDDHPADAERNFNDNAKLIDKVQSLQQEIQELRGQLEVQAHDLKLLQQQQVAFYKDLDARLSGNSSTKPTANKAPIALDSGADKTVSRVTPPVTKTDVNKVAVSPVSVPVSRANPADEQISYLAAYELIKSKCYDDAIAAMDVFVQKYPKGGYSANAQYWLGELYLVKKDYPRAVTHFNTVLQQFPTSSKSAASMLKVGYAYAEQGNKQEARKFLQQVVRAYPNTPTAQLASSKLSTI